MLPAGFFPSEFSVCDGSTDEVVVSLSLLGASCPGESSSPIPSGLSLVGGDAGLLEVVEACGLLGRASNFPSLEAATAPSSLRSAAALRGNVLGVLGTLLHKVVAPARNAEGSEGRRASGSEEERLQYRGQGAASR